MLSNSWIIIIQTIAVLLIIFVLIVYYQIYVKKIFQEKQAEDAKIILGPNKISFWERVFQLFLVFLTAIYAIWTIGLSRLVKEDRNIYGIIGVLVIGGLMVFGYYLLLLWENRRLIDSQLSQQTKKQRLYFYLKIIVGIIVITLIRFFIN